jgi:5-oxoprolinase (ATP-hydrolysing)
MFIGAEFSIDRGGTFTDIYATLHFSDGKVYERVLKLLSVSPEYPDAPAEGIKRILGEQIDLSNSAKIPSKLIRSIKLGSTVATNALLEKKGKPFGLAVSKGFKDILVIGNQQRPDIFSLHIVKEEPIYSQVIEVSERVLIKENNSAFIEKEIDSDQVRQQLEKLHKGGVRNLAISFCHSIIKPENENEVEMIAKEIGFELVICSHLIGAIPKYLNRTLATCIEAYLSPIVHHYFESFRQSFENDLAGVPCFVMLSDGTLFPMGPGLLACRMIMSGPAGGVKGASNLLASPTISFDMGGTSTDVSRLLPDAEPEIVEENKVGRQSINVPQLAIQTIAAGGGSILKVQDNMLKVGPDSAGAIPGPIIYGMGGKNLTITDANYLLGRICTNSFGLASKTENFEQLTRKFEAEAKELGKSMEQMASDFIDVANEAMCKPIRNLTEARGMAAKGHVLNCFGGASGQHCCAMADILGINQILIHRNSSILSAVGISQSPVEISVSSFVESNIIDNSLLEELTARTKVEIEKFNLEPTAEYFRLYMKYQDSDLILVIKQSKFDNEGAISTFISEYIKRFGFELKGRKVLVQSIEKILQNSNKSEHRITLSKEGPLKPKRSFKKSGIKAIG